MRSIAIAIALLTALAGCGPAERPHNIRNVANYYHVRPGDTLYTIAWRYALDVRDLMAWNRLKPPYTIYPGQRLRLSPPPGYRPPVRRPAPQPPVVATRPAPPATTAPPMRKPASPAAPQKPKPQTRPPAKVAKPAPPAPPPKAAPKPAKPEKPRKLAWVWPLKGEVVKRYNANRPARQGIRIRGRNGDSVKAVEAGKVVYSGNGLKGYRELIIIQHSPDYLSAYARNRKRFVAEGDIVERGQTIAELGDPHTNAPELHFELRYRGKPVNPLRYLK